MLLVCETLAASVDAVQLGFFAWWRLWRRDGEFDSQTVDERRGH